VGEPAIQMRESLGAEIRTTDSLGQEHLREKAAVGGACQHL